MNKDFRVIIADADGTLISRGDIDNCPDRLKQAIRDVREKGYLFSMASGRDLSFMRRLRESIIEEKPKEGEAILYEDVCLEIGREKYVLGGLNPEVLERIKQFYADNGKFFEGLVPLPNNNFTIRYSWVTEEFARGEGTNKRVLDARYDFIKRLIEERFEGVEVTKSADGIDVVRKGANKLIALERYLEILRNFGVNPEQILVIGDAKNDEGMLERIMDSGGFGALVGEDKELERRLRRFGNKLHIPENKGPLGTAEVIEAHIN